MASRSNEEREMSQLDEISLEALVAEDGMPVSAGRAAITGAKMKSEEVRFSTDGLFQGGNSTLPAMILTPVSDDLFDITPGVMFFVDGFLSNITINGADWIPPRTGPLGPTALHIVMTDGPPDPNKATEIQANEQEIFGLKGSKLYFTEGRFVRMTKAEPVRIRVTDAIRALPQF